MQAVSKSPTSPNLTLSQAEYDALLKKLTRQAMRQRLWAKIGYVPHAEQAAGHAAIDAGAKQIFTVAGRRGGKSEFWGTEMLTELAFGPEGHLPQRLSLIAAPESDITANIFDLLWKWVVDEKIFGVLPTYKSIHERRLEMPWKAKAYGKTTKDPKSLRGPGLVMTVADEYAFGPDCVAQYLLPPLVDCDGICGIATTPDGKNHSWKTYEDWRKQYEGGDSRYFVRHWTSYQNPYLPAGAIARLEEMYRRTGSYDIFRQEYLAEFVVLSGAIYPGYDEAVHVREFAPLPDVPVVLGIDWGFVHPFACVLAQVWGGDQIRIFDEVYMGGLSDSEKLQKVKARLAEYGLPVQMAYCDPSSPQAIKTFREGGIPIFDPQDVPGKVRLNSVNDGIAVVRGALEREDGVWIHPRCENLRREFPEYRFAGGVNEVPVKLGEDALDATRYMILGTIGVPQLDYEFGFAA